MKNFLCGLILLFGLTACYSAPKLQDQVSGKVQVYSLEHGFAFGSAVPITNQIYLTCAHVVEGADPRSMMVDDQKVAGVLYLEGLDAALLFMQAPHGKRPWRIDNRDIGPAEEITVSGWGLGDHWWSRGLGTLSPKRVSLTIIFGDSGAPVMDAEGDLLAIVCAMDVRCAHHTQVVPMTEIIPLLPESVRDYLSLQ
jgi:hypothetical protein